MSIIKLKLYILFLLYILLLIYIFKTNIHFIKNSYESFDNFKTQIVISRYSEDISWINNEEYSKYDILCYNKGKNCKKCSIKDLPNVGRCDHTYIYHIVNNYDNLADVTIFLPGSCMDSHKRDFTNINSKCRFYK